MASISHNSSLPGGIGCRKRIWKMSIAVCYIHVLHTTLLARLLLHTGGNMHALQSSEPFLLPSWRKAHQCQFGQPSSSEELLFCTSKKITAMCCLMLSLSTCSSCQAKIIASETFVSSAKPHQLFQPNGNTKHRVNWTVEDKVDTNWKLSLTLRGFVCFKCHFPPLAATKPQHRGTLHPPGSHEAVPFWHRSSIHPFSECSTESRISAVTNRIWLYRHHLLHQRHLEKRSFAVAVALMAAGLSRQNLQFSKEEKVSQQQSLRRKGKPSCYARIICWHNYLNGSKIRDNSTLIWVMGAPTSAHPMQKGSKTKR